jgi:hypothetical protein
MVRSNKTVCVHWWHNYLGRKSVLTKILLELITIIARFMKERIASLELKNVCSVKETFKRMKTLEGNICKRCIW